MLKIAIPNKGQLAEPTQKLLREAGYLKSHHPRDLVVSDPENDVEFFFLRPRDVATYVGAGTLDFGITGKDLLIDSKSKALTVMELGFGQSSFRLAVSVEKSAQGIAGLKGSRIATSYPNILQEWLTKSNIKAEIVVLDGAVENAIILGVADAVADVVDTGTTLKQAGLVIIGDPIIESQAILLRGQKTIDSSETENFIRRISSVLVAREYVMVDYDIEQSKVEIVTKITPGIESPTISPLHETGWVAVRAMTKRKDMHRIMDELYAVGAKGVIATEIMACRL
ncbi:MAG: ATP phosphoribosyltransferase [Candidatus Nanopelagicales bacterium]|jgi:ATP phosphoribosyltransferase|nr:ATP phosphoribosyltransferase [Candidatus Nanopelagicales bacterium]MBJ7393923.1 ATP phosphoribosyltransferase [Candidatus Nanopelagicales bacterium]